MNEAAYQNPGQLILLVVGVSLLFGVVFGAIELIKRRFGVSPEIMRRVAHIASGILVIIDYYCLPQLVFVPLVASGAVTFYMFSRRKMLTSINEVSRRTIGQYVLTFGYLAAYFIALPDLSDFVPTVLIVTFADSLAGLAGTLMKAERKTWLGSAIFLGVAFGLLIATGVATAVPALLIALSLTAVERFTPFGLDNFTVPVASALLLLAF